MADKRYLTKAGFERFAAEHRQLWTVERRKVVGEVTVAAAHGDRSENAEYQYGKRRLREIDRRLQYLTKLLEEAVVVDPAEAKGADRVFFGCFVTVEDEEGETARYQLVGPDEFDAKAGRISLDSPLGKLLLGRRVGDTFVLKRPKGDVELTVLRIANEARDSAGSEPA
jgi:transcription elongation factor GreB